MAGSLNSVEIIGNGALPAPSMREIADQVASDYGVTFEDMRGRSRVRAVSHARHRSWRMIRELLGKSYPHIARFFHHDHSTVVLGVQRDRMRHPGQLAPLKPRGITKEDLQACASKGMSLREASEALGENYKKVGHHARQHGVKFRTDYRAIKSTDFPKPSYQGEAVAMIDMARRENRAMRRNMGMRA